MVPKDQKTAWIATNITVQTNNFKDGRVIGGPDNDRSAANKNIRLGKILTDYEKILLENDEKLDFMSLSEIKELLTTDKHKTNTDFYTFTQRRIEELKQTGKTGNLAPLKYCLDKVKEFYPKPKLDFGEINVRFLERLEKSLLDSGKKRNTISIVLRNIRTMFNDAMDEFNVNPASPVILNYPFRKFKIESEITQNRNLSVDVIRRFLTYKALTQREEVTRDIFLLQFMLFGINIKDLFYLKHSNVVDGRLQYKRFKTDRAYNIKIEPEAKKILDKYKGDDFLLWFADSTLWEKSKTAKPRSRQADFQYKDHTSFLRMLNNQLYKFQSTFELKLPTDLTTYFARHSFASIMHEIGISSDDISLCLGHVAPQQNLKTSGIYINKDYKRADVANRKLINHLFVHQKKAVPIKKLTKKSSL